MKSSLAMSRPAHASANRGDSWSVQAWGSSALLLGGPGDLLSVLVGAGQEEDVVAHQPVPPGQGVGVDRRVGVPDMGRVLDVVDRGGDEVAGHCPPAYRPGHVPPDTWSGSRVGPGRRPWSRTTSWRRGTRRGRCAACTAGGRPRPARTWTPASPASRSAGRKRAWTASREARAAAAWASSRTKTAERYCVPRSGPWRSGVVGSWWRQNSSSRCSKVDPGGVEGDQDGLGVARGAPSTPVRRSAGRRGRPRSPRRRRRHPGTARKNSSTPQKQPAANATRSSPSGTSSGPIGGAWLVSSVVRASEHRWTSCSRVVGSGGTGGRGCRDRPVGPFRRTVRSPPVRRYSAGPGSPTPDRGGHPPGVGHSSSSEAAAASRCRRASS